MLSIFTKFADFLTYNLLNLEKGVHFSHGLHFFIEDITKIFFLLIIMVYSVSFLRAGLNTDKIRNYLKGKNRIFGYFAGAIFGSVTPFCSCSGTPLFLAFTQARIPIGITMSFLITSPIINEVAVVLLGSLLGLKFMVIYVFIGLLAGVIGGAFMDLIKAEKYLTSFVKILTKGGDANINFSENKRLSFYDRHIFAKNEFKTIFKRVWKWIFIGVGLGAVLHGYIPKDFIINNLSSENLWSVPMAVLLGIPLYSNTSGVIPIAETLIRKGLPVGTTLAFMMSVVAASFPEFMILKQVMKPKLLFIFFSLLLILFTLVGFLLNYLY